MFLCCLSDRIICIDWIHIFLVVGQKLKPSPLDL